MPSLFISDEDIKASPPIVGYQILKLFDHKRASKVSIFDVTEHLKNESWFSSKNIHLGMIFLFAIGAIEFEQPYLIKNV